MRYGKGYMIAGVLSNRLNDLEKHLLNQETIVYDFGKFMAEQLVSPRKRMSWYKGKIENQPIYPSQFFSSLTYETQNHLPRYEHDRNRDYFLSSNKISKKWERKLTGLRDEDYDKIDLKIPEIVTAICPRDFANLVIEMGGDTWGKTNVSARNFTESLNRFSSRPPIAQITPLEGGLLVIVR